MVLWLSVSRYESHPENLRSIPPSFLSSVPLLSHTPAPDVGSDFATENGQLIHIYDAWA